NMVLGVTMMLAIRATGRFVPLYIVDDITLVILSLLQGLVFARWLESSWDPRDPHRSSRLVLREEHAGGKRNSGRACLSIARSVRKFRLMVLALVPSRARTEAWRWRVKSVGGKADQTWTSIQRRRFFLGVTRVASSIS